MEAIRPSEWMYLLVGERRLFGQVLRFRALEYISGAEKLMLKKINIILAMYQTKPRIFSIENLIYLGRS